MTYLIRFSDFSLFSSHRKTPVVMSRKTLQGSILGPDQFKLEINNRPGNAVWDEVFKNGQSKICGKQPLKTLKGYDLLNFSAEKSALLLFDCSNFSGAVDLKIDDSFLDGSFLDYFYKVSFF